jgi:hypothetical protein
MSKNTTDLRLAQNPNEYRDVTARAEGLVDRLIHHGEEDCANDLFELIHVLTDTRVDASDREGLSGDVMRRCYPYTTAGQLAMEEEIHRINPRVPVPVALRRAS